MVPADSTAILSALPTEPHSHAEDQPTENFKPTSSVALSVLKKCSLPAQLVDRLLRRVAGHENVILHNFLRVMTLAGLVVAAPFLFEAVSSFLQTQREAAQDRRQGPGEDALAAQRRAEDARTITECAIRDQSPTTTTSNRAKC